MNFSDGWQWEDLVALAIGITAILGAIAIIHRMIIGPMVREVREFMAWLRKFQRDWDGEAEEPGRDRIPGVMERLNRMDGELQRNHGSSLKDKVYETWQSIEQIDVRVTTIEVRQREIMAMIDRKNA